MQLGPRIYFYFREKDSMISYEGKIQIWINFSFLFHGLGELEFFRVIVLIAQSVCHTPKFLPDISLQSSSSEHILHF